MAGQKEGIRAMIVKPCIRPLIWVLVLSLALPAGGFAQGDTETPAVFRQEELDQMLAPIALYPDPLLVQILMAATYPLEVALAAQWVKANCNLKDRPARPRPWSKGTGIRACRSLVDISLRLAHDE